MTKEIKDKLIKILNVRPCKEAYESGRFYKSQLKKVERIIDKYYTIDF